ncbi:MAG TPA: hypothetical protein VHB20_05620 [Verrucomicrobiae bacterium]|jgi:hypothetical protein|nr:hypothetical protein [Verrucomicrobiae bacterium]
MPPTAPAPSRLAATAINLAAAANLIGGWPLRKWAGREPDCWRRTLGLGLRSEACKFGLTAFGLRVPSSDLAPRLAEFLRHEPEARWALRHGKHHVERIPWPQPELAVGEFSGDELQALTPRADAVLAAHRVTRLLPESARGAALLREAGPEAQRLLSAAFLSIEPCPANRFQPPDFCARRDLGLGFLNFVARPVNGGRSVDLWLNVHHTASDGAPMQEMLSRLEAAWGCEPVAYPGDDPRRPPHLAPCQVPRAGRALSLLVDFIDLAGLVQKRRDFNARSRAELGADAPLSSQLIWSLAQQPEFHGRKFSTAIDVPAGQGQPRAVDLIAIRPADFPTQIEFSRAYLELVRAARARRTISYKTMRTTAQLHPGLAFRALAANAARTREVFGSVGLSILKDAKVFTAPMADTGFADGFMALGGSNLPTAEGGTVAAFTVKGDAEQIRHYPAALRAALR